MLYTKLPTSAIDFDDSVNGEVYGKYRSVSAYFWQWCIYFCQQNLAYQHCMVHHCSPHQSHAHQRRSLTHPQLSHHHKIQHLLQQKKNQHSQQLVTATSQKKIKQILPLPMQQRVRVLLRLVLMHLRLRLMLKLLSHRLQMKHHVRLKLTHRPPPPPSLLVPKQCLNPLSQSSFLSQTRFSHMRTTYSSICADLCSHGYVVASVEHTDQSTCIALRRVPKPNSPAGQFCDDWVEFYHRPPNEPELPLRNRQVKMRK